MIGEREQWTTDERGQFVVLSATVVAVALGAVLLTYVHLGAHPDVRTDPSLSDRLTDGDRVLSVAVHEATGDVPREYGWSNRAGAATVVRDRINASRDRLADAHVESGVVYRTRYNRTAARAWADSQCPSGPDRQFGPCRADRGVVVQRRAGRTHVLAVAVDLSVTTERAAANVTHVFEPVER